MTTATKERKTKTKGGTALAVADLKRALSAVAPAVPSRSPKPVLTNVLLSGETLSATDLELRIDARLDCYDGPAMLLPHARLSAIVGELGDGDTVTLRPDGAACVVDGGRVNYRLPIEDAAEFPGAGEVDAKPIARLPADQFLSLVQSVKFATDNESSRYALGGVLVQWKAGMLSFVGTDGRRMCVAETEIDQATDDVSVIVPRRAVDVLCRLARHAEEVQLSHAGSELIATVDGTAVRARLVEGRFPRWTDVEPTRTVKASLVVVDTLLHACRQAAICTSEQSRGVTFRVEGDELHLSSRSAEYGEASVTAELIEAGHSCTVNLDPKFVVEWLGCGSFDDAETVELEAESATSAVVLRAQDCRCVIMPLSNE
jgi:DNA polymerase-3 subunit beta